MDAYIMNRNNWKKTGRKVHELWMCMPPIRTIVKGEYEEFQVTEQQRFVICSVGGAMWTCSGAELARDYSFATGEEISEESIRRKKGNSNFLDWTKIKSRPGNMDSFALLLPKNKYRNMMMPDMRGVKIPVNMLNEVRGHGRGDYLVCPMAPDGGPNIQAARVVNGVEFPFMFNLQNMQLSETEKMKASMNLPMPKSLLHPLKHLEETFKIYAARIMKNVGVSDARIKQAFDEMDSSYDDIIVTGIIKVLDSSDDFARELDLEVQVTLNAENCKVGYDLHTFGGERAVWQDWQTIDVEIEIAGDNSSEAFRRALERLANKSNKFREITSVGEMTIARLLVFKFRESFKKVMKKYQASTNEIFPIDYINGITIEYGANKNIPESIAIGWKQSRSRRVRSGHVWMGRFGNGTFDLGIVTFDIVPDPEKRAPDENYERYIHTHIEAFDYPQTIEFIEEEVIDK